MDENMEVLFRTGTVATAARLGLQIALIRVGKEAGAAAAQALSEIETELRTAIKNAIPTPNVSDIVATRAVEDALAAVDENFSNARRALGIA